jgi:flagellar protein FliS
MRQTNPQSYYLQTAVETATPTRRVVMLFDGAIRFLSQSIPVMHAKNYEEQSRLIGCAQNIILHLRMSFDREADPRLALNLDMVYSPLLDMLTDANIFDKIDRVDHVIEILRELREAWSEVDRQCQVSKAAMRELRTLVAA